MESKKHHEKVLEYFEKTIDDFSEAILNQAYITKEDLKVKIKACVINSIKGSKKQGSHEAQIIVLSEKIKFRTSEYTKINKELIFVRTLYKKTLSETELEEYYEKIKSFRMADNDQLKLKQRQTKIMKTPETVFTSPWVMGPECQTCSTTREGSDDLEYILKSKADKEKEELKEFFTWFTGLNEDTIKSSFETFKRQNQQ